MTFSPLRPALLTLLLAAPGAASAVLCTASTSAVGFGVYSPAALGATDSTGQVTVSCSRSLVVDSTATYSISLSAGNGSYGQRQLRSGGHNLNYNLYTSSAHSTVWGDGSGGTATVGDSLSLPVLGTADRNYPVYGRIPSGQMVAAGSYADSLVVTITY